MKITKQQLKQIIKEEIETTLNEIEGMSPEECGATAPSQALGMARDQQRDPRFPYSEMSEEELTNIIDTERQEEGFDSLKKLTSANVVRKEKYGIEDAKLDKELETSWQQYKRSPGHGRVGGKY